MDHRVTLISPYFGQWPIWFPAFLKSCSYNPDFFFIIPTDCDLLATPDNVQFIPMKLADLQELAEDTCGLEINLSTPYLITDLKPIFGQMFPSDSEYWGYCDIDVIWGNLMLFIGDKLGQYDVISSRKYNLSGHFTLYLNNKRINSLYKKHWRLREILASPEPQSLDEAGMTPVIREEKKNGLRIYWDDFLFNYKNHKPGNKPHEYWPSMLPIDHSWRWIKGRLLDPTNEEIMYLHFMSWKNTIESCNLKSESFVISNKHIV
jgi:hypothetical protein